MWAEKDGLKAHAELHVVPARQLLLAKPAHHCRQVCTAQPAPLGFPQCATTPRYSSYHGVIAPGGFILLTSLSQLFIAPTADFAGISLESGLSEAVF